MSKLDMKIQYRAIRRIDCTNRITIPKRVRNLWDLKPNDRLVFEVKNNLITISKYEEEEE